MPNDLQVDVTTLLEQVRKEETGALDRLARRILPELRACAAALMSKERAGHLWQTTALVNEAFLRLLEGEVFAGADNRAYLFAAAARAMRCLLVDYARTDNRLKRGGGQPRQPLDESLAEYEKSNGSFLALHEALGELAILSPRQAQVVELRFFGGHTAQEVAALLRVSLSTVEKDFAKATAFLLRRIQEAG